MKKLLLVLSAVVLSTSALAAPAATPIITGYNVLNAAPSGTGDWTHEYTGTITDLGGGLRSYTDGTGTLADGIFSNSIFTTQLFRPSDNTSITIFLDDYYEIGSVSIFGGPENNRIPGQITEATFSFPELDLFLFSKPGIPFGDTGLSGQPVNDLFNLGDSYMPTTPSINQFTISNIGGSYYDASYNSSYFSISEIQVSVTPVPEPSTYALMLGGLGLVGFMAARRRRTA
jgi:hypothetical protein